MRRKPVTDILVAVLSALVIWLAADALVMAVRVKRLKRQLEEEQSYNEMADAEIAKLGKRVARLTDSHEQMHLRYVQLTREQLTDNYVLIHRNVTRKESKSGN
jgi:uncharacterized membrane protein (DUF106 family)